MIDAAELRDLIRQYGAEVDDAAYQAVYGFGIWYADQQNASEVVLSDWTPANQ
jgi:hypothetical protein